MGVPVRSAGGSPAATQQQWDPFRELMEGLFAGTGAGDGQAWTPRVDIEETDDAWIVDAEVPGVKRKDVNVEAREGELIVTGEIKERERVGILRRRTRRTGEFELRVTLPGGADPEGIDASIEDGVLTIRIPKPDRGQTHQIEVSQGSNG